MNTKLEVIRLENSDVISTSGVVSLCAHINTFSGIDCDHIYVYSYTDPDFEYRYYYPINGANGGDMLKHVNGSCNNGITSVPLFSNIDGKGWYYYNGSKLVKCEDQSDEAHPYINVSN